jgi:hypothetical protein
MLSLQTGAVSPARCDANFCPYCAPFKARMIGGAIALSMPQRMVRFSLVPDDFKRTQAQMRSVVRWMRRNFDEVQMAYHVEPNPKGTGNHLHAWEHGPNKIPQRALQEACHRSGFGIPDIRRFKVRGSVTYGLKGVSYGMKHDDLETFLSLNGGRLVHATHGFWRDSLTGERLTLEEAKTRFKLDNTGDDQGPWVLRHESEVRQ